MELQNQIFNSFYTQIVEGGITFKLDIFESNILNLSILVGGLFYILSGALLESLSERQKKVVGRLDQAFYKLTKAIDAFLYEEDRFEIAQFGTQFILKEGEERAKQVKETILREGKLERIRIDTAKDVEIRTRESQALNFIVYYGALTSLRRFREKMEKRRSDLTLQKQIIDRNISKLVE